MRTADICPTCSTYSNALCTLYNGATLPNTGILQLDSLETALIKIDSWASTVMPQAIGNLTDVNVTGLINGQVLAYNSTSGNFEPLTFVSGTDTSEWATYTGSRLGNNMNLEFGDYDNTGTSNFKSRLNTDLKVFEFGDVDAVGGGISAGFNTNQFRVGTKTTPTAWGIYTSLFDNGIIHANGATGNNIRLLFETPTEVSGRDLTFPNANGTILVLSDSITVPTPTSAGTKGEIRVISGFRYECIAGNVWIRMAVDVTW